MLMTQRVINGNQLNKLWYIHTIEYYATIKRDDIDIKEMMYSSCP